MPKPTTQIAPLPLHRPNMVTSTRVMSYTRRSYKWQEGQRSTRTRPTNTVKWDRKCLWCVRVSLRRASVKQRPEPVMCPWSLIKTEKEREREKKKEKKREKKTEVLHITLTIKSIEDHLPWTPATRVTCNQPRIRIGSDASVCWRCLSPSLLHQTPYFTHLP